MEIAIVSLSIIIIGLLIDRYLFAREMTKRLSESMKAVMSRNINEFLTVTAETPKHTEEPLGEAEEVELRDADEKTFDKMIKEINK